MPRRNKERVQIEAQWVVIAWILIVGEEMEENKRERENVSRFLDCVTHACRLL